jgi:hypothetical protein
MSVAEQGSVIQRWIAAWNAKDLDAAGFRTDPELRIFPGVRGEQHQYARGAHAHGHARTRHQGDPSPVVFRNVT